MASNKDTIRIEKITLDDGRVAERHITTDASGNEVVEIFAEEKRPLKLEKRIVREMKSVVAKETHETIRDGEVTLQEVVAREQEVPLQVVSRMGVADHYKVVDGDYVHKNDIDKMITDGVVAGITALMENMEPVAAQSVKAEPVVRAQEVVAKSVEEKKKGDMTVNVVLGAIIVVQLVVFGVYMFFM